MAIDIQNRGPKGAVSIRWLRTLCREILKALDLGGAELSVLLTDDAEIREINREWRNKDKATDVLSFPQDFEAAEDFREVLPKDMPQNLGDVVISVETAKAQAERLGFSLQEEITRLMIHGVLHLLGHDHVHGGRQAAKMKAEEERVLLAVQHTIRS